MGMLSYYLTSPFFLLSMVVRIGCAVHVVRSGRNYLWLWVCLMFGIPGCLVYLIAEVLPGMGIGRRLDRAGKAAAKAVNPAGERKRIEAQLAHSDTLENRLRLARECVNLGDHEKAAELFASCLKGAYATDPAIMLELAQARFAQGHFAGARATLDSLIAANPDFRSVEGHLLYARTLEGLGDHDAALHEYQALTDGYPGEEARARQALLLNKLGRADAARALAEEIRTRLNAAPKFYRQRQAEWLKRVERELA